jgi:hypothetical protein
MDITRVEDGMDGSLQYQFKGQGWRIDACIEKGRIILHIWLCEGHGREALKEMEDYAEKRKLKVVVTTVISGALEKILRDNGYVPHDEEFELDGETDSTDVWEKAAVQ